MLSAALLALVPKCAMCVVAYLGLGTALGLTGPELCGAATGSTTPWIWAVSVVSVAVGWWVLRRRA